MLEETMQFLANECFARKKRIEFEGGWSFLGAFD